MAEEVPLKAYHLQGSLHQRKDASKGAVGLKDYSGYDTSQQ